MTIEETEVKPRKSRLPERAAYATIIVLLITIGAMGWLIKKRDRVIIEKEINEKALTDEVKLGKDKDGNNTAKIASFQTAKVKDFLAIQSKNKEIKRLQDIVSINRDRLGSSGTVTFFDGNTKVVGTVKTEVTPGKDTYASSESKDEPDTLKKWPIYNASLSLGKWVNAQVTARKDSTTISVGVFNEYSIINGADILKKGFLGIGKKTTPFVEVTNYNPYSINSVVRSYNVRQAPATKKWIGLGAQIGYNPLNGKPYVGLGVSINPISL